MSDPNITLILRSFNEGWALRDTLPAIQAQEYTNSIPDPEMARWK